MKMLLTSLLAIILLVPLPACAEPLPSPSAEPAYHKISAGEAQQMMLNAEAFVLLDVRTEDEYVEKRIEGALLIPDYEIKERAEAKLPDKTTLILIYCRSGRRSKNAANELVAMGYANVYDFGGIIDWPYDTVSGTPAVAECAETA